MGTEEKSERSLRVRRSAPTGYSLLDCLAKLQISNSRQAEGLLEQAERQLEAADVSEDVRKSGRCRLRNARRYFAISESNAAQFEIRQLLRSLHHGGSSIA